MKIGPIQEQWLQRLEQHPELQMRGYLGELTTNGYLACCLGEYLLTYKRIMGEDISRLFHNGELWYSKRDNEKDGDKNLSSLNIFTDLGLYDEVGSFEGDSEDGGRKYNSLAEMNDNGVSWPEIAAYIRKYPEMVFTKSI